MIRRLTLALVTLLCTLCYYSSHAAVTTTYHPVYFATDSFNLTNESVVQLAALAGSLPTTGEVELYISGHTDAEGNSSYNLNLSQQRVTAVQQALIQAGISPGAIHTAYYGEDRPVAGNTTSQTKAQNRRVEIAVKHTVVNTISDIIGTDSSLMPQQFAINTATPQAIKGRKGIEIAIPANAFVDAQGKPVTGNVTVTLTEFTDVASAFMHGVTSMSTNGLLESGGMYRLEASANGQPLQLQAGKTMDVKIPAQQPVNDMSVYLSQTDANGQLVWVKTDQAFNAGGQPQDTRNIPLNRSRYTDWINRYKQATIDYRLPVVKQFTAKPPVKPVRPVLRLDKIRDLKTSGVRHQTANKKQQLVLLDRMNADIEKANARRKAKYEAQLAVYLADSATYPARQEAYRNAYVEYAEYIIATEKELDSIGLLYSKTIIEKRIVPCLNALLDQSEKGTLYNCNLLYKVKQMCASGELYLRDHDFERKLQDTYIVLTNTLFGKACRSYHRFYFDPYSAYAEVAKQPEFKAMLTALVDDNPYLTPAERTLQYAHIKSSVYYAGNTNPVVRSYYAASIGQLGYVNCDRLRDNDDVVPLLVTNIQKGAESVAFVKNLNASQGIYTGLNRFKRGEELRMLSVYFKDGRPQVAYSDLKANKGTEVSMVYKEMKLEEFKALVLSFI